MYNYQYSIIIGRFSPIHSGHEKLIQHALSISNKVIILIGSCGKPRDIKNPFTFNERQEMILSCFNKSIKDRIIIKPIYDYIYNDSKWIMEIQETVDATIEELNGDPDNSNICIIGGKKDNSSYYLDMFPQWKLIQYNFNEKIINATDIREMLFTLQTNQHEKKIKPFLNENVYEILENYFKQDWFKNLILEYDYIKKYKESWLRAPYPPIFTTVDSIIICSGHVLMIKRRAAPGKGLMAIPGGFLNQDEKIQDGMIRELREETKLKVPIPILNGSIKIQKVFDHPTRSMRGRTITHAFLIDLGNGELPRVKGSDDAEKAFWLPLNELDREKCFEDHYDIICDLLGIN